MLNIQDGSSIQADELEFGRGVKWCPQLDRVRNGNNVVRVRN
jgi:hypothetical protein